MPALVQLKAVGSSPLARGTSVMFCAKGKEKRLIPARAGNIGTPATGRHTPAAHPRSRGEHATSRRYIMKKSGSSPLARGTY